MVKKSGGEGGIRTPDSLATIPVFETGAFNRSATSPWIFIRGAVMPCEGGHIALKRLRFKALLFPKCGGGKNCRAGGAEVLSCPVKKGVKGTVWSTVSC